MGDLSRHLSRHEFTCGCGCGFDTVDAELVLVLETVAQIFTQQTDCRTKIHITSGCRCLSHNETIDGSITSKHVTGKAADFWLSTRRPDGDEKIDDDLVAGLLELEYPQKYGIGRYLGRTHVDVRDTAARWDKR